MRCPESGAICLFLSRKPDETTLICKVKAEFLKTKSTDAQPCVSLVCSMHIFSSKYACSSQSVPSPLIHRPLTNRCRKKFLSARYPFISQGSSRPYKRDGSRLLQRHLSQHTRSHAHKSFSRLNSINYTAMINKGNIETIVNQTQFSTEKRRAESSQLQRPWRTCRSQRLLATAHDWIN